MKVSCKKNVSVYLYNPPIPKQGSSSSTPFMATSTIIAAGFGGKWGGAVAGELNMAGKDLCVKPLGYRHFHCGIAL